MYAGSSESALYAGGSGGADGTNDPAGAANAYEAGAGAGTKDVPLTVEFEEATCPGRESEYGCCGCGGCFALVSPGLKNDGFVDDIWAFD